MNWNGIMHAGLYSLRLELRADGVAVAKAHRVDVIDVTATFDLDWRDDVRPRESGAVVGGTRTSRFGPRLEVTQLDPQDGSLDAIHPVIETLQRMLVAPLLTPTPQQPHRLRELWVT